MSRAIATYADELLAGDHSNTMGQFYSTDTETPGIVVLGSANKAPNPDLVDTNSAGKLRGWNLGAPPSPDSWNVYMRRTTRINTSGQHVVLEKPAPMLRQNLSVLPANQSTYQQDHPLLTDKSLPDLKEPEPTDLAPIQDAPRVEVVTLSGTGANGSVGYPAGSYWFSYCGIIGDNPMNSQRLTTAAPAVQLTGVLQGQVIHYFVPDEVPDSWSGIAFLAGPTITDMRVQKRVDIRGKVLTTEIDHGPYTRAGKVVDTATDRTFMGSSNEFGAPIAWRARSPVDLQAGDYELSYKLLTKQGPTASQPIKNDGACDVSSAQNGEALCWVPPKEAVTQPGIIGWIPEFKGKDGKWYTFESAKGGYPLTRAAKLHTEKTDKDGWGGNDMPVKEERSNKDRSGVAGPTDAMEVPVAQGAQQMVPGKYAVRVTNNSEKEDMESRPSPRTIVTLRDQGFTASGVTNGLTDQAIRVYRPHPQNIKNSGLLEVDPATGAKNLHWQVLTPTGVAITDGDGYITVADTSASTSTTAYRRSSTENVNITRFYTVRFRMNITRWVSGSVNIVMRFFDSTGTLISTTSLETFRGLQDTRVKYTIGPDNSSANYDFPANTTSMQITIQGIGASGDTRNFDFAISDIGVFIGRSSPRKLYDLLLAEDTPGRDGWPVPDAEQPTLPYPAGPYCRVTTSPSDPAKHVGGTVTDSKRFEDGSSTSGGWTVNTTTGGALGVNTQFALRGMYGARSNITASSVSNYGAYIWKDYFVSNQSSRGFLAQFRIKSLPSSGNATILGVTRDANLTSYLAQVQVTSAGVINLQYWNGASTVTVASSAVAQMGDDLRVELVFTGLRTSSGSVTLNVKRNDRPNVFQTAASLNWSAGNPGGNVYRVLAGYQNGSVAGATARLLFDGIKTTTAGINEGGNVPGNMVEYWAPEGQPANDEDHMLTGGRWPCKPGQNRTFSFYMRYQGVTTPSAGASVFRLVVHDKDGNPTKDLGYVKTDILGRDGWDRYSLSYSTGPDAAYVEVTRHDIGDGVYQVMGVQDELGSLSSFVNTNALSGTFNVVLPTTFNHGPMDGDPSATKEFTRMRAVTTHAYNVSGVQISTVSLRARGSSTLSGLASATWVTNVSNLSTSHRYVEIETTLTTTDATKSPEVRAVFLDIKRHQPVLCYEDGRDFDGGIIAYALTPSSPIPNVVRKEYANGSVGLENVGRGLPERVKLSLRAYTDLGKRQAERNAASSESYFMLETDDMRYVLAMAPEFAGFQENDIEGMRYFDYAAEGIEADVIEKASL